MKPVIKSNHGQGTNPDLTYTVSELTGALSGFSSTSPVVIRYQDVFMPCTRIELDSTNKIFPEATVVIQVGINSQRGFVREGAQG